MTGGLRGNRYSNKFEEITRAARKDASGNSNFSAAKPQVKELSGTGSRTDHEGDPLRASQGVSDRSEREPYNFAMKPQVSEVRG